MWQRRVQVVFLISTHKNKPKQQTVPAKKGTSCSAHHSYIRPIHANVHDYTSARKGHASKSCCTASKCTQSPLLTACPPVSAQIADSTLKVTHHYVDALSFGWYHVQILLAHSLNVDIVAQPPGIYHRDSHSDSPMYSRVSSGVPYATYVDIPVANGCTSPYIPTLVDCVHTQGTRKKTPGSKLVGSGGNDCNPRQGSCDYTTNEEALPGTRDYPKCPDLIGMENPAEARVADNKTATETAAHCHTTERRVGVPTSILVAAHVMIQ